MDWRFWSRLKRTATALTDEPVAAGGLFAPDRPEPALDADLLGRKGFAQRLAATIADRAGQDGLVIGLYGPWGDGKTTLLSMIEGELKRTSKSQVIWFNPWYFKEQDDLVQGFLTRVAVSLELRLGKAADELKRVLNKYGTLLSFLPTAAVGMDFGKPMSAAATSIRGSTLEDLKGQLERGLAKADVDLVVFIDDLDRLARKEIHFVLRLVKLVADFRRVTYVLAFDDEMVAAAIAEQYGDNAEAGRSFLEKIVQVPLRLPRPEPRAVRDVALREVDRALTTSRIELSQGEANEFRRYFDPLFESKRRTLREAKRFGNALAFALPLLDGEVRVADLLLLEALRAFAPILYRKLPEARSLLLGGGRAPAQAGDHRRKAWSALMETVPLPERQPAEDMLHHLVPRVRGILENIQFGSEWDATWAADQRVTAESYFDRYFLYAVPRTDVPDREVRRLLEVLQTGNVAEATKEFGRLVNESNADQVVQKLRVQEERIPLAAARTLIEVVVGRGHMLPNPSVFFSFRTARAQSVVLAFKLLKRLEFEERGRVLIQAMASAPDVGLAAELFRRARYTDEDTKKGTARVVSEEAEKIAQARLIERIENEWKEMPFYLSRPSDASLLLHLWSHLGQPGAAKTALTDRLSTEPEEALNLLGIFLGQGWSMDTGLPVASDFERDQYNSVSLLLDPGVVAAALAHVFGDEALQSAASSNYPYGDGEKSLLTLAKQFLWVHERVKAEKDQARQ